MDSSWITNIRIRRQKKTFAEVVIEGKKSEVNGTTQSELGNINMLVENTSIGRSSIEGCKEVKAINFSDIYKELLHDEPSNSSQIPNSPPKVCADTSSSHNATCSNVRSSNVSQDFCFNTQDKEILDILEELQCSEHESDRN